MGWTQLFSILRVRAVEDPLRHDGLLKGAEECLSAELERKSREWEW